MSKAGMMRIYIAGPITGKVDYRDRFANAETYINNLGHYAVNPVRIAERQPFSGEWRYKDYIDNGLELLSECDGIYMLKGWKKSAGAHLEEEYAKTVGIVRYEQGAYEPLPNEPVHRDYY